MAGEGYRNLRLERKNGIVVLYIDRPKALNALNRDVLLEIQKALGELEADREVRVLVITGAGDKSFIAGGDVGEMSVMGPLEARNFGKLGQHVLDLLEHFRRPTIAAINGYALGGGCELAMACDIRVAAEEAVIGQPEVCLGIIPGFGGTQRLPRLVGAGKAKQLILTGERIPARQARDIGLVDIVVPREKLMDEVMVLAGKIASNAPVAVRHAKECINNGLNTDLRTGLAYENQAFGVVFTTGDKTEGTRAFLEKREPKFEGR